MGDCQKCGLRVDFDRTVRLRSPCPPVRGSEVVVEKARERLFTDGEKVPASHAENGPHASLKHKQPPSVEGLAEG